MINASDDRASRSHGLDSIFDIFAGICRLRNGMKRGCEFQAIKIQSEVESQEENNHLEGQVQKLRSGLSHI